MDERTSQESSVVHFTVQEVDPDRPVISASVQTQKVSGEICYEGAELVENSAATDQKKVTSKLVREGKSCSTSMETVESSGVAEGDSLESSEEKACVTPQDPEERRREKIALTGTAFLLSQLRSSESPATKPVIPNENKVTSVEEQKKEEQQRTVEVERKRLSEVTEDEELPKKLKTFVQYSFENAVEALRECAAFISEAPNFGFSLGSFENNYIKCCKWNSDGCFLATTSQDRKARIFQFSFDEPKLTLDSKIALGDLIYDLVWHPSQNWFVSSCKDHPINAWKADGSPFISFHGINQLDELDSAQSLCFSLDGRFLYAGYRGAIRIFDVARPGKQVKEVATWKKKIGGQKGIISCISMNPVMNGVYAAGCYGRSIALYSDYSPSAECIFENTSLAVTHLRYSSDGNLLFTAGRKDDCISCWDLRFPGQILSSFQRPSTTNQRIYFEIDSSDRFLFSGSSSGDLFVFDSKRISAESQLPVHSYRVSRSTLSGVSLHPSQAVVAVCSGQRVFPFPLSDEESISDEETQQGYEMTQAAISLDNCLSLWNFSLSLTM